MVKKNVFLIAYTRCNLGDDLFVQLITSRYKNVNFHICIENLEHQKPFLNTPNLNIITKKLDFTDIDISKYDCFVYIGGSVFIERLGSINRLISISNFISKCKNLDKAFFYISSNFGPYTTNEYFDLSKELISNCEDISFRDRYSKSLFKDFLNVRYAPDAVFCANYQHRNLIQNSIGISVIDLMQRSDLNNNNKSYISFLTSNIINYIIGGNQIYLFSFCKYEGDEKAIELLLNNIPLEYHDSIHTIKYDGDVSAFLSLYSSMEFMICTRFHSMILSSKFGSNFYVISYSKKINNVIEDLELTHSYININELTHKKVLPLSEFSKTDRKILDKIEVESFNSFKMLDKAINN